MGLKAFNFNPDTKVVTSSVLGKADIWNLLPIVSNALIRIPILDMSESFVKEDLKFNIKPCYLYSVE